MHAWHGHDERRIPPLVLGHEAVGRAASGQLAGKRVAINPLMTCGNCAVCASGNEHLCATRELIGMRVPGAFAEQVAINNKNLTEISDNLSSADAALAEPLACAVNAVNQATHHTAKRMPALLFWVAVPLACWPRWCSVLMVTAISKSPRQTRCAESCSRGWEISAPTIR